MSRLLRSIAAECRLVVQAYLILQLEAYALLAAAIAGFLALTIVMFVILRVDWSAGAVLAPLRAVPGCCDYRAVPRTFSSDGATNERVGRKSWGQRTSPRHGFSRRVKEQRHALADCRCKWR